VISAFRSRNAILPHITRDLVSIDLTDLAASCQKNRAFCPLSANDMAIAHEDPHAPADSPFHSIRSDDLTAICSSPGFQILRQFLSADSASMYVHFASPPPADLHLLILPSFCTSHIGDPVAQSIWVLHRDILHGLTMPVVQLYHQASSLAAAALCTDKVHDLELAFRGEARGAFIWMQCFMGEDEEWCYTRGCPACTTLHILSTESTVRATLSAAQLSIPKLVSTTSSLEANSDSCDPSLPDFSAVLPAMEHALNNDPFWGPGNFDQILSRSTRLTLGIHDLISQCSALEALVSSAPSSPTIGLEQRRGHILDLLVAEQEEESTSRVGKEIKLKKSRMAKRQLRLREEQKAMIMRMAWQCWSALQLPAEQRMALRSVGRRNVQLPRRRSLTSP
jgi:hypothetical protein